MLSVLNTTICRTALSSRVSSNYLSRSLMTLKDHKYTAEAIATGLGHNGTVKSNGLELSGTVKSNGLKLNLALPKELGGPGDGENPEQLFAMGYASCLLGTIQMMAGRMGKSDMAKDAVVRTSVHIGESEEMGGFGFEVDVKVEGIDEELLKAGHEACPYSRALQHGIVVNVSVA